MTVPMIIARRHHFLVIEGPPLAPLDPAAPLVLHPWEAAGAMHLVTTSGGLVLARYATRRYLYPYTAAAARLPGARATRDPKQILVEVWTPVESTTLHGREARGDGWNSLIEPGRRALAALLQHLRARHGCPIYWRDLGEGRVECYAAFQKRTLLQAPTTPERWWDHYVVCTRLP